MSEELKTHSQTQQNYKPSTQGQTPPQSLPSSQSLFSQGSSRKENANINSNQSKQGNQVDVRLMIERLDQFKQSAASAVRIDDSTKDESVLLYIQQSNLNNPPTESTLETQKPSDREEERYPNQGLNSKYKLALSPQPREEVGEIGQIVQAYRVHQERNQAAHHQLKEIPQNSAQHPELQHLLYSPPTSPKTNRNQELVNNLSSTKNRNRGGKSQSSTKLNFNFLKKIGTLAGSGGKDGSHLQLQSGTTSHKVSADYTSDSGTFHMQKSEFSSRKNLKFGRFRGNSKQHGIGNTPTKSIISKVFSFKWEADQITKMNANYRLTKRAYHLSGGMALSSAASGPLSTKNANTHRNGSYFNKSGNFVSNQADIEASAYLNSTDGRLENQKHEFNRANTDILGQNQNNHNNQYNWQKALQSQYNISPAHKKHHKISSFTQNHSTLLSTREVGVGGNYMNHVGANNEMFSSTPGQIKHSMRALQSSVNALLERAYGGSNYNGSNQCASNYQLPQYPTLQQIKEEQMKQIMILNKLQQSNQNIHVQPFKLVEDPNQKLNDLNTPLIDRQMLIEQFRISLHENQYQQQANGQAFTPLSPPFPQNQLKRGNQSNRHTREINAILDRKLQHIERTSKTKTEGRGAETIDDGVSQSQEGVRVNSNYPVPKSQYGFDVDEAQLNYDELQLFALLQEPNNEEALKDLLDRFPYQTLVNLHNTTGYSALHVATCNNNSIYTQILISHILNSSKEMDNDSVQRDQDDDSMFERSDHQDERDLVERHLNLSQKAKSIVQTWINQLTLGSEEQFAAMHFAAFNGNLKIMQMLERFGGDVQLTNNQGLNCMHFAAQGNYPNILHYLVKYHQFQVECLDSNGCSCLHWACVSGSYQAVRYLLAEGANPNLQQTEELLTPLHMTIKYLDETKEIRTIHKLLIYGAFIDSKDENGNTPTDYVESIEDEDLKEQCIQLINDVAYKSNGLFPCFKRCRRVNRSLKTVRNRKFFFVLLFGMIFQFFSWVFYICPMIKMFDEEAITEVFLQAIIGVLNFIVISLLIYLWRSDPGFINLEDQRRRQIFKGLPRQNQVTYEQIIENIDFKFVCAECKIIMSKRSRHCYCCNSCVERFDHHCDWIDNCVGVKNHSKFMVFIFAYLAYMLFTLSMAIDQLAFKFGRGDQGLENFFRVFPKQIYLIGVAQFMVGLFAVISLTFFIPLASLISLQLKNLCQNTTTYERFTKSGQKQATNSQSTTAANQNQQPTDEQNALTFQHEEPHPSILLLQSNDDGEKGYVGKPSTNLDFKSHEALARLTEDSDEIEALRNLGQYEKLKVKANFRDEGVNLNLRATEPNMFMLNSQEIKLFEKSQGALSNEVKGGQHSLGNVRVQTSGNYTDTSGKQLNFEAYDQVDGGHQENKSSQNYLMPLQSEKRDLEAAGKPSMTSLNRPSQAMDFQSHSSESSLLTNERETNVNHQEQEIEEEEDEVDRVDTVGNTKPVQVEEELINHNKLQKDYLEQRDLRTKQGISGMSRANTTSTDQKSLKGQKKRRFVWARNFRMMCCCTDIKSQDELFQEHIARKFKKKNEIVK